MPSPAHAQAMRHLALAADLARLRSMPVPFLVIKGPVLAALYDDPSTRRFGDLDVVVHAAALPNAIDAMEGMGAQLLDANWDAAIRERWGQVHMRMPHGTLVDLHWHLLNAGRVRNTVAVDMADVWRGVREVQLPGGPVRTLSVTNTVVHVAMHAGLGGAWQHRWYKDVEATVASFDVDWSEVVQRATAWRVARPVGVALARASAQAGAEVPDSVLDALLGPALRALLPHVDRVWQPERAVHEWSAARLWPHVLRDSWADTARAAGWRLERRARNGVLGFRHNRTLPHEMEPRGDAATKTRYLRLVASGAFADEG
jgi:hypothetical protein